MDIGKALLNEFYWYNLIGHFVFGFHNLSEGTDTEELYHFVVITCLRPKGRCFFFWIIHDDIIHLDKFLIFIKYYN